MNEHLLENIRFDADGLIPAVVQDASSDDVLMLAYMNDDALRLTVETKRAHYWSRGRGRLWRKGETSGHEQIVTDILVNCEQNSLLLRVHQVGAVCHDGYDTCFYRTLDDDGKLTIVRDRAFDPDEVYAKRDEDALAEATRSQYGAYAFLRQHNLESVSGTSRRLRAPETSIFARVADELRELAGVLDGTHRHGETKNDVLLEASQVIYWILLATVRQDIAWSTLRPDRALQTTDETLDPQTASLLLLRDAEQWQALGGPPDDLAPRAHATLALVGQGCRSLGVDPLTVVLSDMAELKSRSYLRPYFSPEAA